MQYALLNGKRELATPGALGHCPMCAAELVAKCGRKTIWHWAHKAQRNCDPWWENETPWHIYWKSLFPEQFREAIHVDPATNERHIADIKTENGLVIELQNSPMPLDELRSRESFYKHMLWVVNGAPFKSQFHVLDKLPDPKSDMVRDLVFKQPEYNFTGRIFWRKSENIGHEHEMVWIHSMFDIAAEIEQNYIGHHMFHWVRPRSVWYDAVAPVFFDFGGPDVYRLLPYDDRGLRCVRRISKERLVSKNGGVFLPFAEPNQTQ